MDIQEWKLVLDAAKRAARRVVAAHHPKRLQFGDWLIVAMFLWAVAHDRPQSWACVREHYDRRFRPRRLPSISQFNRRMNHPRVREILLEMHRRLGGEVTTAALSYLDGKPLTVGVASKDPDARPGHVMGGFARGYKLHAWMTENRRIPLWCVMPLNVHELTVAEALVDQAAELPEQSLVLADQNYDSHDLHKQIDAHNGRLVVVPKGDPSGLRHPVTLRQMGKARRELLEVQRHHPGLIHLVHRHRVHAEGILGNLCGYGGGLTSLPPWARRLHRVRRWVGGKILLYHARLSARQTRKKVA